MLTLKCFKDWWVWTENSGTKTKEKEKRETKSRIIIWGNRHNFVGFWKEPSRVSQMRINWLLIVFSLLALCFWKYRGTRTTGLVLEKLWTGWKCVPVHSQELSGMQRSWLAPRSFYFSRPHNQWRTKSQRITVSNVWFQIQQKFCKNHLPG